MNQTTVIHALVSVTFIQEACHLVSIVFMQATLEGCDPNLFTQSFINRHIFIHSSLTVKHS